METAHQKIWRLGLTGLERVFHPVRIPSRLFAYDMTKARLLLPVDTIKESFNLDPLSPTHLRWKKRPRHQFNSDKIWMMWNTRYAGTVAGHETINNHGRRFFQVRINHRLYCVHRVVYALVNGVDCGSLDVDHIDGCAKNNDPANLRLATHSENLRNRGKPQHNTSGRKGVSWREDLQKWRAKIKIDGCQKHLGYFKSIEDASAAYEVAARQHFGKFHHQPTT